MDWLRYRTVGFDLLIVGALVLLVSLGFALSTVCSPGGLCGAQVDWPTLTPSLVLLATGGFVLFMVRRQKRQAE